MEPIQGKRIVIWAVVAIAVIAAAGFAVTQLRKPQEQPVEEQVLKVEKKQLPQNEIPSKLPENLPIEKEAKVLQNFSSTTNDGRAQSTRAYETAKSLADNLTIFSRYMKANGWIGVSTVDNEQYKMVAGKKGNERLHIEMNTDPETKARTVTISLTELAK